MNHQDNEQWKQVLQLLQSQLSKPSFDTWLKSTTLNVQDDVWVIHVENEFARAWIAERYFNQIKKAIFQWTGQKPVVTIVAEEEALHPNNREQNVDRIVQEMNLLAPDEKRELARILVRMLVKDGVI